MKNTNKNANEHCRKNVDNYWYTPLRRDGLIVQPLEPLLGTPGNLNLNLNLNILNLNFKFKFQNKIGYPG